MNGSPSPDPAQAALREHDARERVVPPDARERVVPPDARERVVPSEAQGLAGRLAQVRARIDAAARSAGRDPDSVRLLAVSKTFDADLVLALAELGQRAFGENYVQEAVAKMDACRDRRPEAGLEWHFIGPIQSNKTRSIAERFDWVHSIDRAKIATRLGEQRPETLQPLDCCVQVNVSGEASKSGCAPEDAPAVARAIAAQPRLRLRGVMAIPEPTEDLALQRMRFAAARAVLQGLRDELAGDHPEVIANLDTLSMGMSADLESAVAEGATIVRIGSALFGHRPQKVVG
jgi:pyridoxal phosphate enzyme (YggS family)